MENSLPPQKNSPQKDPPTYPSPPEKSPVRKISLYFPIAKTICKEWAKLKASSFSPGSGRQVIVKDISIRRFDYAKQIGCLKI